MRSCDKGSGGEVLPVCSDPKILALISAADNKGASWQTPLLKQAGLTLPLLWKRWI